MSQAAILEAVAEHLREAFGLTDLGCKVMFDGQPPPMCGQEFIAVHEGEWDITDDDYDLDETYGVIVTVTRRVGNHPIDKIGSDVLYGSGSKPVNNRCREIITSLHHNNQYIRLRANDLLNTLTGEGFITPLRIISPGRAEIKNHAWFHAAPPDSGSGAEQIGVARSLSFTGARRIQGISTME